MPEKIIEEIKDEKEDDYSNLDIYNIDSWGADLSFRELVDMYKNAELIKPEMQRKYVWDKTEASRFVESVLLGLPVPSIFLAKTDKEEMLIVDGYQRIMTIYDYINGIFSGDNKTFKLSNSKKINSIWRNKSFNELSQTEQRKIKSTTIHAIIFRQKEPKNDDTGMYQIFERINTAGRILTSQEIRNCVYQGKFNKFLIDLNLNSNWRELFGLKNEDQRMRDIEFVLRFFALSDDFIKNTDLVSISLKEYLNKFMGENKELSDDKINIMKKNFETAMDFILINFGKEAFNNIGSEGKRVKKFHPTIFDAIAISTLNFLKTGETAASDLKKKREDLLKNDEFKNFISVRTTNLESIRGRISKASEILYAE